MTNQTNQTNDQAAPSLAANDARFFVAVLAVCASLAWAIGAYFAARSAGDEAVAADVAMLGVLPWLFGGLALFAFAWAANLSMPSD